VLELHVLQIWKTFSGTHLKLWIRFLCNT